jgi:hypothetical protein
MNASVTLLLHAVHTVIYWGHQWRTEGRQGAMVSLEQQPHASKLTSETTGRQKNRSKIRAENAQQYYKRSVLIPLVASCLAQLSERFQDGSNSNCQ